MVSVTKKEHELFLTGFIGKMVYYMPANRLLTIRSISTETRFAVKSDGYTVCLYNPMRPSDRYVFCLPKDVFVFLTPFDEIDEKTKDYLGDMDFKDNILALTLEQANYLKSIDVDIPLWFGIDHDNNFETAIDLGLALEKKEFQKFISL